MKFVEFKVDGPGVAFVNPLLVMTVEAFSKTSKTSKLFFGRGDSMSVMGQPDEVAAALAEGLK